ncbi:unnamed protein product [Adineta ricciae]|uniref:Uncharacterized protein n=1 Tax=Adineta ricciae TaxID=249248 RepID=A0A814ZI73_ADIRI|nr:unnamed protein product [Adineta ricciae]
MLINESNFKQIIDTIRKVHQTSIDQRLIDLTDYLTELFQSIQIEQTNIFEVLTKLLHDYEDRAALKIEFLKGKCLESVYEKLNTNETHLQIIFEFVIELLKDSENVQEKFLEFNGYDKYFQSLCHIHSPTNEFLNQLILLLIEKPEDASTISFDSYLVFNNPHLARSLIEWIPYLKNSSSQQLIISSVDQIISRSLPNKMMACGNGVISSLLRILRKSKEIDEKILSAVLSLLNNLARFSINPQDIRLINQLLSENIGLKKELLQLLIISAKHDDPDTQLISSYFDLQRPNSGIVLPAIQRWPSLSSSTSSSTTGQHFTFHCWIRPNHEINSYPYEGRRQIYSFYSNSIGFESFLRSSSIFVLISDRREIAYIEIQDCDDLIDGFWHSLTIVHAAQRPSLFGSAFQSTLTCQLSVYIDGLLRKEIKNFKYVLTMNEPINLASIGSASQRPKSSEMKQRNDSLSLTLVKSIQPLKGLFSSKSRTPMPRRENQDFYSQNVMIIDADTQDTIFGHSTCLYGQIACIWILAETLDEQQVKSLHEMGNHLSHSSSMNDENSHPSTIFDSFCARSLLLYHPLACNNQICLDISGYSSLHGRLINGSCLRLYSFAQSLSTLGGCSILYPLIELFQETDYHKSDESFSSNGYQLTPHHHFYSNPIASIIHLIRCVLSSKSMVNLTEQMTKHYNVEILVHYFEKLSPVFLDQQFLISIEELIESTRLMSSSRLIINQLIEYVLLDFNLWKKSNFYVRLLHLQYIFKILREENKIDRDKFNIQFFLDILRQHFNTTKDEIELREVIYEILRYLFQNQISSKTLNIFLSTISVVSNSNDELTSELLEFLSGSLTHLPNDGIIEQLCEPNMAEGLYALLTSNNLTSRTKELVLRILKTCLESQRISQSARAQLRLETNHIGFGGIISGIAIDMFNELIVEEILDLIIASNSAAAVHHLNVVLTLCSAGSINVRFISMRKLMAFFLSHENACHLYAKCHGWQETLAHFFVQTRRLMSHVHHNSSPAILSLDTQVQRLSSIRNNVNQHRASIPIFDVSSPDGLSDEKFDLSLIKDQEDLNSSQTFTITPTQSINDSKEDLLSSLKPENSNEELNGMIGGPDDSRGKSVDNLRSHIRASDDQTDGDLLEEMCETLILAIVMILWKGIVGHDDAAWMNRGQMFSALRHLQREYDLYISLEYIERRILELSMETCLNEMKSEKGMELRMFMLFTRSSMTAIGQDRTLRRRLSSNASRKPQISVSESNIRELIKLINDFLSQSTDNTDRITDNLVNGIITIFDTLLILKIADPSAQFSTPNISPDDHYSETSISAMNILLILLAHSNINFCSQASNRIHLLLNYRSLNDREEAAYLLSKINQIFLSIPNIEHSEHYNQILPLMKIILEKSFDLLQMNAALSNIPLCREILATNDDFRQFISSINRDEWRKFVKQITEPYADHYCSMSVRPFQMNMKIWWNNCQEMINISIHKRNRQIGVEKLKFQTHIVDPWHKRARSDEQRISRLSERERVHTIHVNKEWKDRKKYWYGERGLWLNSENLAERRWMLSNRENIHRMKCKLIENDRFNLHEESSRLRDNLNVETTTFLEQDNLMSKSETMHHHDEHDFMNISAQSQAFLVEVKEKPILGVKCSLITPTAKTHGEFLVTDRYLYFIDSNPRKRCENDLKYPLIWLQDIQLRRYNLRPTALEFFLINQTNFLLNLNSKLRRQVVNKFISLKLPSMKNLSPNSLTPQEIFRESKILDKWMSRELSNFDYLMMLNTIAGRTYNDLNQYPVFPWIIKDFTSQVLDLKNPDVFRDFSKPVGIQNPKHIEEVKSKYESFEDPSGLIKKFHYGTHYSNAASVMHYLIRMEPFTTLHIQLQSGKFDIADRQFHSFQSSWSNIMDSPNDGKELIPEFFYLPEFLCNLNKFDLGKLQSNNQLLNDVQLPPWAHDSPEEFIRLHRLALESDYVSAHLHKWIDLIFGYKQTGQAAIDALNVYMYCSYERPMDADVIDDNIAREAIDGMIENFGQSPSQLLTEPHPQRQTREQVTNQMEAQGRGLNMFQNLTTVKAFFVEVVPENAKQSAPIIFISIPKNQTRSFINQGIPDVLISINNQGVIGNNGWHPYDKTSNNFFTFDRDPTLQTQKNRLTTIAPFALSIDITSRLFAVSHDAKYIFSGAHWDRSLRTYSISKTKSIHSITRHTDIITCLTLDSTGYILITGSRDTTCIVWYLSFNDNRHVHDQEPTSFLTPERILYGHSAEVTCLAVSSELDLVVSGSLDGTCNIHTLEHGTYVRTLRPTEENDPIVNLKLSDERHILVQTEKNDTYLFLYSINGHLIRTRKFEYQVIDMILSDQYIVLAVNHQKNDPTSGMARIIIKDLFEMTTIQTIRLRTQITCLYLTKDQSHLLVSVKDGKLFVLTSEKRQQKA